MLKIGIVPAVLLVGFSSLIASCGGSDTLVIYSGRSESLVGELIEQFESDTGIEVDVRYGGSSLLAATLLEEGEETDADVFFAQDPASLVRVKSLLAELPDELSENVPDWALDSDNKWLGTTARIRTVVYNTDTIAPGDLPSSIEDFASSDWADRRIGWAPTNGSFQAMVTVMRSVWGDARTRAWLEGIHELEPTVYPNNTSMVNATADGEIDLGFTNHYYLHRIIAERGGSAAAANHYLEVDDPGGTWLLAGAGILESADAADEAEQFVEYLLSEEGQRYFAAETFEAPVGSDLSLIELSIAAAAAAPTVPDGLQVQGALNARVTLVGPSINFSTLEDLDETQAMLRDLGIID